MVSRNMIDLKQMIKHKRYRRFLFTRKENIRWIKQREDQTITKINTVKTYSRISRTDY